MELHPAHKFNFTPQPNGGVLVRSRHYLSEELCSRNPVLQWAGAGGVALLPATYLKGCQHEADKLSGFFVLHGPERWTDGPVLLYSIYPMHSAEYFHLSRGRFGVMQWPRGTESFALPGTSWRYMATPDQRPHLPRLQPSARTLLSSPDQPECGQDETIHSAQAMAPSNCRRFLRDRDSHSTPRPIAADGTPRMSYVEAGLGVIGSNKQDEDVKAVLTVGSRPATPLRNSYTSLGPVIPGSPRLHNVDEASDALVVIQEESLKDGPINLTKLSPKAGRLSLAAPQDRGGHRRSRKLSTVSADLSSSTRGRSQHQQGLVGRVRESQSLGHGSCSGVGNDTRGYWQRTRAEHDQRKLDEHICTSAA